MYYEIGLKHRHPKGEMRLGEHLIKPEAKKVETKAEVAPEGTLQFETGTLSKEEVGTILNTLPVDITFVDKDDTLKYFSKGEERLFVQT